MPAAVSMADDWYEAANVDHFWIKHRFKIFRRISRKYFSGRNDLRVADVGCGHGILQRQLEETYNLIIDGYDLNQAALQSSIATNHPTVFYDINERHKDIEAAYDIIFLFDVIEHLPNEATFLESVRFHLKPQGLLVVNVPALPWLFSKYDKVVGHYRRYTRNSLNNTLRRSEFAPITCTYWGLLYIPIILARKLLLALSPNQSDSEITQAGFKPPTNAINRFFDFLSDFDPIPNLFSGSSLMGIYRKN